MKFGSKGLHQRFKFVRRNAVVPESHSRNKTEAFRWSDAFCLNIAQKVANKELTLKQVRDINRGLWQRVYQIIFNRFQYEFVLTYLREILPQIQELTDFNEQVYDAFEDLPDFLSYTLQKRTLTSKDGDPIVKAFKVYEWSNRSDFGDDKEDDPRAITQAQIECLLELAGQQLDHYTENLLPACKKVAFQRSQLNFDLLGIYKEDVGKVITLADNLIVDINNFKSVVGDFQGIVGADITELSEKGGKEHKVWTSKNLQSLLKTCQREVLEYNSKIVRRLGKASTAWAHLYDLLEILQSDKTVTYQDLKEIYNSGKNQNKK